MSPISVECGTRMDKAQNQPSHCDARSSGGLYTTDWLRVQNGDPSFFLGPRRRTPWAVEGELEA